MHPYSYNQHFLHLLHWVSTDVDRWYLADHGRQGPHTRRHDFLLQPAGIPYISESLLPSGLTCNSLRAITGLPIASQLSKCPKSSASRCGTCACSQPSPNIKEQRFPCSELFINNHCPTQQWLEPPGPRPQKLQLQIQAPIRNRTSLNCLAHQQLPSQRRGLQPGLRPHLQSRVRLLRHQPTKVGSVPASK